MKRIIHIALCQSLLLLALTGCQKYHDTPHDLSGNNYIAGTVYVVNDYNADNTATPLTNQPVMVTDPSLPMPNFLFSVNSDGSGGFVLPNLRDGVLYTVFSSDSTGGILFTGSFTYTLTNDETPYQTAPLNLYVDSLHQNGFIFTVLDAAGNIVPGDTVLIYSSADLVSKLPRAKDTCLDCNLMLTTNSFGMASAFNLVPGPYTAYFTLTLDSSQLSWKGSYPFQLNTTQFVRTSVTVE